MKVTTSRKTNRNTVLEEVVDFLGESLPAFVVGGFFAIADVSVWHRFQSAEHVVSKTLLGGLGIMFAMVFLAAVGTFCVTAWVWISHSFGRSNRGN